MVSSWWCWRVRNPYIENVSPPLTEQDTNPRLDARENDRTDNSDCRGQQAVLQEILAELFSNKSLRQVVNSSHRPSNDCRGQPKPTPAYRNYGQPIAPHRVEK